MANPGLSDEQCREALDAVTRYGNIAEAARAIGVHPETFRNRVNVGKMRFGYKPVRPQSYEARVSCHVDNGRVIVFSDAHYMPGQVSAAHRAMLVLIEALQPVGVILNGDAFDGASISRWPRIGWDNQPTVKEELDAVEERLSEVEKAAVGTWLIWNLGNHDTRYETFLAANAPQYQHIDGFSLKDHFPNWRPAWRTDINPGEEGHTIVKHRAKGGIHATRNNALNAAVSVVTGHLHCPNVRPMTNARGTVYGVDSGCLAPVMSEAFTNYTEDNVKDWRSGFAVLTYRNGRLLMPELLQVVNEDAGIVEFRGEEFEV